MNVTRQVDALVAGRDRARRSPDRAADRSAREDRHGGVVPPGRGGPLHQLWAAGDSVECRTVIGGIIGLNRSHLWSRAGYHARVSGGMGTASAGNL